MKLVFIYGPPASGKLTVAKELAKLTGFKLFDNHVSIRFVESLFEFGTRPFLRLLEKYRLEMIEEAAKHGVDTIFTFVYETRADDPFVRKVLERVKRNRGTVHLVRLECDRKELERRVTTRTRKSLGKVSDKRLLNSIFRRFDLGREIPFQPSLTIESGTMAPKRAARTIAAHFGLRDTKQLNRECLTKLKSPSGKSYGL